MNREIMRATLRVTQALADLQRVRILMMLQNGELCVCQIVETLGLAPSTISKHLFILSNAGLLNSRKDGRWMHYRLPSGASGAFVRPVLKWLFETLKNDETIKQDAKKLQVVMAVDRQTLCRRQRKQAV